MSRFASRKFVLALLTLGSTTWLLTEQLISAADFKTIVMGTVAAYIAGNVAQKATEKNGTAS